MATFAGWGHPGGPSEQQEGHMGVKNHICNDCWMISGPRFESFLGSYGLNSFFCSSTMMALERALAVSEMAIIKLINYNYHSSHWSRFLIIISGRHMSNT